MKFLAFKYTDLSPSIRSTIFITIVLLIVILIISKKLDKYKATDTPKGIIVILEWLIGGINDMCKSIIGRPYRKIAPYVTTLAIFLFVANISGLLGLTPPTASVSCTLTLGIMTFTVIQFTGIRFQGIGQYLKGFIDPNPLFLPINIIGELATPISLGLRLFGNILSGSVIMGLVYSVTGYGALVVAPLLHCYFDVFSGFIQTLVFCTLTTMFIAGKLPDEEVDYFDTHKEIIKIKGE